MKADLLQFSKENETVYEELLTVIEASRENLALLIAVCDDLNLRDRIIQRYEQDLKPAFKPHRLQLANAEPSLRGVLGDWAKNQVEEPSSTVLTVTGAESLQWVKLQDNDSARTEIQKFFGYLQWGREGLREFPYPVVLWITQRILKELSLKAPDFWSWRKGVFRFILDPMTNISLSNDEKFFPEGLDVNTFLRSGLSNDSFLLSLEDLQELIAATEQREGITSPLLGVLYNRLAQVYQRRVEKGQAENLQQESDLVIANYQKAIALHTQQNNDFALVNTLLDLGWFQFTQSNFKDANSLFQQSLQISQQIGDLNGEANSLNNLGNAANFLGQYPQAIAYHEQSLQISRDIGDRNGEANSLIGLGNAANFLGQYPQAIAYHEQSLQISRDIGDQRGQADVWFNLGNTLAKVERVPDALGAYRNARQLYADMGLEAAIQDCDNAIENLTPVPDPPRHQPRNLLVRLWRWFKQWVRSLLS
jgi:tetratricopeptide (TPR) repeat protein